jgi:hypothetical protein
MNPDYFLRMVEDVGQLVAALAGKEGKNLIQLEQNTDYGTNDTTVIKLIVKQFLEHNKFNEAENFLYALLEKEPSEENFKVASWFYSELLVTSPSLLEEHNFSSAEVVQGMKDLKELKKRIAENK